MRESDAPAHGIPEKFLKPYNPAETEEAIYRAWEKSGYFNPDTCVRNGISKPDAETFSIVLPPPNVTGTLHLGHAEMLAIEDALVRFNRMRGRRALWIPGTDHAAIATQSKVEREIYKKEKKNRHDLGRDEFLKRVELFAEVSHDAIVNQLKRMGSSLDWSREAFTLDEKRSRAVQTAFKKMYDAGLIYRGHRVVNWDPKGQTTISDDEIEYREEKTTLYTFRYSKDFPIPIATTRPETKLGDTAVAVNPSDARYRDFVGNTYEAVVCGVPLSIKVVADEAVDPAFGTGAVGVTPAHSMTDFDIAKRHDLPHKQVINEYGKMMVGEGILGLKTKEAREKVALWFREHGLMEKEEGITHRIATAERTLGIIEPLPKLQWFVDVSKPIAERGGKTLKELMQGPVEKGEIHIVPEHFAKIYFHWIDNLRDWCISRQIWYGHRVPVWYRHPGTNAEEVYCGIDAPEGDGWEQDQDTLDTWFSSGLWSFSTLGWPEETSDLAAYHPTTVLETGYDILFFWVARMILMTEFLLGEVPFHKVYLHGLVRDPHGKKMSKSLGNSVDPLDMIDKYGADAVRLSLLIGTAPGTDLRLSEDKMRGYKNFANKLWNVARFILQSCAANPPHDATYTEEDRTLLKELATLSYAITEDMESYRLYLAADKLYHYVWHTFADNIIEKSKPILAGEDAAAASSRRRLLGEILETTLKLLHPFMPFVTEEIWSHLPAHAAAKTGVKADKKQLLLVTSWPV